MRSEAGAELVRGTSLKAALDRDWDQQLHKDDALTLVLQVLQTLTVQEEKATTRKNEEAWTGLPVQASSFFLVA